MSGSLAHKDGDEELRAVLQRVLSRHFGTSRQIHCLRRQHSAYASSWPVENLTVTGDYGQQLRLVLKNLSPRALLDSARRVRPPFLYDPLREIEAYRKILNPQRLGTPLFYGAVQSPALRRYWLFLERVDGPLLWQVGTMDSWRQAARWLARLHTEFDPASSQFTRTRINHLLRYDRKLFSIWLARAESFLKAKSSASHLALAKPFNRLATVHERVIDRLLQLRQTLIHGEFYPSNIILRQGAGLRQICVIDWEVAGLGPGLIDLAALTSGEWDSAQERQLVSAYRDALDPANGWPPPMPELLELVHGCQFHLAVKWLGWAVDWSPPRLHARNWLREALRLAKILA